MTEKCMMIEAIKRAVINNEEIDIDFNCEFFLRRLPSGIIGDDVWGLHIKNKNTGRSYDFVLHWDDEKEVFI